MADCAKADCENRVKAPWWKGISAFILQMAVNILLFVGGIWFGFSWRSALARHRIEQITADRDHWQESYTTLHSDVLAIQTHFDEADAKFQKDVKAQLDRIERNQKKGK